MNHAGSPMPRGPGQLARTWRPLANRLEMRSDMWLTRVLGTSGFGTSSRPDRLRLMRLTSQQATQSWCSAHRRHPTLRAATTSVSRL